MKVSVLTTTVRPWHFLLRQLEALEVQTLPDFEWIVADNFGGSRDFTLKGRFPITIAKSRGGQPPYMAEALAKNSGLSYCQGDLVFFLNDYVLPTPKVLERHYQLYQEYGPRVFISGPLRAGDGNERARGRCPEMMIGDGVGEVSKNRLNSADLSEFWAGRNDSAALEACLAVNGFDECIDGGKGGIDLLIALRMSNWGARHIIDMMEPCDEYSHVSPGWAKEGYDGNRWVDLYQAIRQNGAVRTENSWSIADEQASHFAHPNS